MPRLCGASPTDEKAAPGDEVARFPPAIRRRRGGRGRCNFSLGAAEDRGNVVQRKQKAMPMSKKPKIVHDYDSKKDRLEITLKHFDLGKKWLRRELIDTVTQTLDKKSVRKRRGRKVKDPIKNTRLEEVGD
jgi:hypothetical protein